MYESYCGFCWTQCSISGKTMVLRSFHFMVLLFTKHKDTYYKHTNKYRHIVFYHMVQWLNCRPMKYIELSSLVLFFLCCHFYRHKYMPDWKSMLQRIVVCMRVCLCVLSSVTMNEWMNKLNRIEAILFIFMVKYMTSKQCDSNEYRIIPFKRVIYFYFNNFPHFILYIGASTQKKRWKKLIWKSFKKKNIVKLIMSVHNIANTMCIITISPDNSSLGLSDHTKLLFYSNGLNFSFFCHFILYEYVSDLIGSCSVHSHGI